VRDAPDERDAVASLELRAKRAVARERERSFAEQCKRVGEAHDVLPLLECADAQKRGGPGGAGVTTKRERSTPLDTTSVLPRAAGTFVSSSRRR